MGNIWAIYVHIYGKFMDNIYAYIWQIYVYIYDNPDVVIKEDATMKTFAMM